MLYNSVHALDNLASRSVGLLAWKNMNSEALELQKLKAESSK